MQKIEAFGIGRQVIGELYSNYKMKYNMDLKWWSNSKKSILPVPAVFATKEEKSNINTSILTTVKDFL